MTDKGIKPYSEFLISKLGSGVFLIYIGISTYFLIKGKKLLTGEYSEIDLDYVKMWLRLSEAYITYNAASYLLTAEKTQSLPHSKHRLVNFCNWFLNNFFSRKVFVFALAMLLIFIDKIDLGHLFEIGIFMLGGRMVEKFSRGIQQEMTKEQVVFQGNVSVKVDEEEGEA